MSLIQGRSYFCIRMSGDAWQSRGGWPHMALHHTLQEWLCMADSLTERSRAAYQLETPENYRIVRKLLTLYLTNCKCKIMMVNGKTCQKSYFYSILAIWICFNLRTEKKKKEKKRTLKGQKALHLYPYNDC